MELCFGVMLLFSLKPFSIQKIKAICEVPLHSPGKPLFLSLQILKLPPIYILTFAVLIKNVLTFSLLTMISIPTLLILKPIFIVSSIHPAYI